MGAPAGKESREPGVARRITPATGSRPVAGDQDVEAGVLCPWHWQAQLRFLAWPDSLSPLLDLERLFVFRSPGGCAQVGQRCCLLMLASPSHDEGPSSTKA
jgi:hypothetical protein